MQEEESWKIGNFQENEKGEKNNIQRQGIQEKIRPKTSKGPSEYELEQ